MCMSTQTISVQELHTILQQPLQDSIVIDVRSKAEFTSGHMAGVKNIPLSQFMENTNTVAEFKQYSTVYITCWSGGRSEVAALQLQAAGCTGQVYNVEGGLQAWIAAGYAVQR